MSPAASASTSESERELARRVVPVIAGLCLGLLLAALDQTVFATALPTVSAEFGDTGLIGWINTAYVLAATLVMPVYGRLGDRLGRRDVYVAAMLVFVGASVWAASASTASALIWARFAQGLGGGGLLVLVQAIVADLAPARRRAPYLALIGAVFAASSVGGPLLGGLLTETVGWRWAFWINVPLGLLAVLLALVTYREQRTPVVPGPAMPPRGHVRRDSVLATLAGMSLAIAMFGTIAYLPTYLQLVGGLTPTVAGLFMMALAAGIAAATLTAAQILRRTGRYRALPVTGAVLAAAAILGLATGRPDGSLAATAALLALLGVGIGCTWDVLLLVVQNGRGPDTVGSATAVYSFFREVGVTLGTALVGALFAMRLPALLGAAGAPADISPRELGPQAVEGLPQAARDSVAGAYHEALMPALGATVPFLVLAAVLLCFLTGRPLATSHTPESARADTPVSGGDISTLE